MMGLESFRWRLLGIGVTIILLWQFLKAWNIFTQEESATQVHLQASHATYHRKDDLYFEKVNISVYYEALCPDSRSFFLRQLVPTYQKLPQNLELYFIPFGKATIKENDNDYDIICQHGPIECEANIIHACSIDVIKDPSVQLNYLSCMIKNNIEPVNAMDACAEKLNVNYDPILKCYRGIKGKKLLLKYGELTNALVPHVSFIPTITLNGSSNNQVGILKNLLQQVCLRFKVVPKGCKL